MDQKTITPIDSIPPAEVPAKPKRSWFTLSPVNRKRWERFKAHKLGYRSFVLFATLFVQGAFQSLAPFPDPTIATRRKLR